MQVDFLDEIKRLPGDTPLREDQFDKFEALSSLLDKKLNDIPSTWEDLSISASKQ